MDQHSIQIKLQLSKSSPKGSMQFSWTMLDHAGPLVRWHHKPSNWQGGPSLEEWERASEHLADFFGIRSCHRMMLNHVTVNISSFQKLRFDEVRLVGDTLISWDLWNAKPFQLHNLEKLGNNMIRYGLQRARSQVHTSTLSPSAKKI